MPAPFTTAVPQPAPSSLSVLLVSCVLIYFLALWPWTCYLTSLCFNFFIYKSGDNKIHLKNLKRGWIVLIFIKIQRVPNLWLFDLLFLDFTLVTFEWCKQKSDSFSGNRSLIFRFWSFLGLAMGCVILSHEAGQQQGVWVPVGHTIMRVNNQYSTV